MLGLKLNHDSNEFQFDLEDKFKQFDADAKIITRRHIVSLASQVFDNQGYVSPFIMQFKKLLPMLWHKKIAWDENLLDLTVKDESGQTMPDPVAREAVQLFREWIKQIPLLGQLRFPRWTGGPIQFLAIFGDASKAGMGVAAYAVSKLSDGSLDSQLVFSKTSLMPKNLRSGAEASDALTIARAELIALYMAVNVGLYLKDAYNDQIGTKDIVYFTDSLLNLQRVQRGKGHCKVWEERRIEKILDNTQDSEIRFCPGVKNPADLPSRGCTLTELIEKQTLWTKGPDFLTKSKEEWPKQPLSFSEKESQVLEPSKVFSDNDETQTQIKIFFAQVAAIQQQDAFEAKEKVIAQEKRARKDPEGFFIDDIITNSGCYAKIVRHLVRFKRLAQKMRETGAQRASRSGNPALAPVKQEEFDWAEKVLARRAQKRYLSKEIEVLKRGKVNQVNKLPKGSVLKNIPVYWDEKDQLIRLESRLHLASSLSPEFTNPIILPKCEVAEKRILHTHQTRLHISQRQTFDLVRQKFWVIGNFSYVKSIVRRCPKPRCRYVKYHSPKMSPLPSIRLDNPVPWTNVGVDYLGPLYCKHECEDHANCPHPKEIKVWLILFTCFHSRAIWVELAESCSTRDFLNAFRRFVATQGRPNIFYSDNAAYFTAADKHLQEMQQNVNFDRLRAERFNGDAAIEWRYSTPKASWTHGVTERMIGLLKKQMRVALQMEKLTTQALSTLAMEIANIVNDRPLGVTRQDPTEWTTITPNMLVHGRQRNEFVTPNESELTKLPFSDLWKQRKKVLNHFWSRWYKEYLQELKVDKKWSKHNVVELKIGDVVLIKPDATEKNAWKLARIQDVRRNADKVVSTVTLRLPSGQIVARSVRQVALLEADLAVAEMDESKSPKRMGCAGEEGQSQTGAELVGQPALLPSLLTGIRPCPDAEVEADEDISGEAATVTADPVPEATMEGANLAQAPHSYGLRKRARRKGFFARLHNGTNE